ncbi:MAG: bifunctional nuclease family protein [Planctomycetota bacterium]|jgi:bifunctional DNase/RNase
MDIPVEVAQIIINEEADQQVIVLRELNEPQRSFPIVIGMPEILAIDRRIKGIRLPRPLTHDLLESTIDELGGHIQKVVVHDLVDHTFYATIYVQREAALIKIDSRPSDAIALASGLSVPLFVADQVFDQLMP